MDSSRIMVFFARGLARLPLAIRRRLGRFVGGLIGLFPTRDRSIGRLQIARFLPNAHPAKTCAQVYAHIGETVMESLDFSPLLESPNLVQFHNHEWLQKLRSSGSGTVALSAHLGNWEILGAYFSSQGLKVAAAGQLARKAVLQPLLDGLRTKHGVTTLWRSDSGGARTLIGHLKSGGVVAALIDQDTKVDSLVVPFFGVPAKTPSTLVTLALRLDLPITTAFAVRRPNGGFEIFLEEILQRDSPEAVLAEYHRRLEGLIREYPDQWVWFHKRWRTLPDGSTLSSREYVARLAADRAKRSV